jgi:uncharacterized repeat protein (TIGR01451 family)
LPYLPPLCSFHDPTLARGGQLHTVPTGATFGVNIPTSTVTIIDSIISGNAAVNGGGILNDELGTVDLINSTVSSNEAPDGEGGGIYNGGGTVMLTNSTVISNEVLYNGNGGGIYNGGGMVELTNTTVSGNSGLTGGGICNDDGTVELTNTTVNGNSALYSDGLGGGIFNYTSGEMTLINSTVSGNSVPDNVCGGIHNYGTMDLTNITISGNSAKSFGGGICNDGMVTLSNTIVASNPSGNCDGVITDNGHNLQFPGTTCGVGITEADPLLGPLQLNPPGNTETHALLPGSPAIDAITAGCPPPATDQRGVPRPQGAACDIGAYEAQDADLSLSKMVDEASPAVGETVVFTIQATNNGPLEATGLVISDPLPPGLTFASANTSQGSYTNGTGEWNVGSLTVGLSATLVITATVDSGTVGTTITNTATIAAADQFDPDVANNTAMVAIIITDVPIVDLIATNDSPTPLGSATTLTATVTAGSNVIYTWAFGDGDTGSGAVVTHTYAAVRDYTAVVTASNSISMLTATTIVTVNEPHPAPDSYVYLPLVMRAHP